MLHLRGYTFRGKLTFWESREAIAQFAGENIDVTKYYDFDRGFLLALSAIRAALPSV